MGLFSGGFFGGGTDESSSSTTTNVTTNTTNTTRDVGLTGLHAVALADTIGGTVEQINADFTAGLFDFAQALVAGNAETTRLQREYEGKFVQYQDQNIQKILDAGFATGNPDTSLMKDIALYAAVALGLFFIMKGGM